ncbi:hypothetical protein [Roseibium sp.]|uniref:hypothetical protein n=1 Tax=Roseibium sp. TaxID=1936156 RepID=UPI00391A42A8
MIVSVSGAAKVLGITDRRMRQLREEGIAIPAPGRGQVYLDQTVQRYVGAVKNRKNEIRDEILKLRAKQLRLKIETMEAELARQQASR